MTIFPNGSLLIHRVRNPDEGFYKCVGVRGVSKDEPIQTYTAELRIAVLDDMDGNTFEPAITPNQLTVIAANKDFEMTCIQPSGYPRPHMWWEDAHGKVISDTGRIRVEETRLLITMAKHEDAGNYTCVAENLANKRQYHFQLYISTMPTIITHPVSVSVEELESAQLLCQYRGSPYPITIVTWLKDDKALREDNPHFTIHHHNGTLQINTVHLSDNGTFVCIVNTSGFPVIYSQPAALAVKEKLKFFPLPVNKKLELNSNAKIYCKGRGAIKPTVRWIKEGQRMFEWPSHVRDENGTLFFDPVKPEDRGKYTCVATNFQGVINITIQVDVIVAPKFTVRPIDVQAYEGYPVVIHCRAYGDPLPTIQWDKNSVVNGFDQKRFSVMENGTLYVTEVHMDDQGKYGCTAGNSGGLKREEVSMVVRSAENYTANRDMATGRSRGGREEEDVMTKTIIITLSAATAYLVLVIGLIVWCRYRRARMKKALLQEAEAHNKATENGDVVNEAELKDRAARNSVENVKSDGDGHSHSSAHSHNSRRSRYSYDHLQFPRHDVHTVMLLGKGEFGEVFLAKAHGIQDEESETVVMGDLKQFLLATRKENPRKSPRPPRLNAAQIISMCNQIAQGMEYLSNHRYIHRDVAARNCLVTSKLDIKISNSCLSRDTYASEYYSFRNRSIPIRWMPFEAVYEDEFSTKSDVWAFGVLMWEVCSQADLPHADKSDEAYLKYLKLNSVQWSLPDECPKAMQPVIQKCWSKSPKDRPSFSELVVNIGDINIDSRV
uniref:Receptor protein-tyrosine kinase n=1 Tax=Strigamia maritima TaxID=126957 RepID=T1JEN9_STRMM